MSKYIALLNIPENHLAKFVVCVFERVFLRGKMVDPCLIACHYGFQNWFSSLNRRRCERAISKRRFFYPSVRRFGTQHAHILRCPSSSGTAFWRLPINNSSAVDRFRIATRRFNKISSPFALRVHRTAMCRHDHGHEFSVHQFINLHHYWHTALSLRYHRTLQLLVGEFRRWVYVHCPWKLNRPMYLHYQLRVRSAVSAIFYRKYVSSTNNRSRV